MEKWLKIAPAGGGAAAKRSVKAQGDGMVAAGRKKKTKKGRSGDDDSEKSGGGKKKSAATPTMAKPSLDTAKVQARLSFGSPGTVGSLDSFRFERPAAAPAAANTVKPKKATKKEENKFSAKAEANGGRGSGGGLKRAAPKVAESKPQKAARYVCAIGSRAVAAAQYCAGVTLAYTFLYYRFFFFF